MYNASQPLFVTNNMSKIEQKKNSRNINLKSKV